MLDCGVPYVHLNVLTPENEKIRIDEPYWFRPKGIRQRNLGLTWLHENFKLERDKGVLYIADDDNTYNLQIFKEVNFINNIF